MGRVIKDLTELPKSTFLSVERDYRLIFEKLFLNNPTWANTLKRLLVIPEKDCIDNTTSEVYKKVDTMTVGDLLQQGYIQINPTVKFNEHEEVKNYIIMTMDNFSLSGNPQFRDCFIYFDIICHTSCWDLGNFRQRPLKIAGYIDGILNDQVLAGIGHIHFAGLNLTVLNEHLSMYTLGYQAVHGSDDYLSDDAWLNGERK